MSQPLDAEQARAAKPESTSALGRLARSLHRHISINAPLAELAGKKRNLIDTPKWQQLARALAAQAIERAGAVPQQQPQQGTAQHIAAPGVGFPANLTAFVARRDDVLRDEFATTWENLTQAEALAIGVADKIAEFKGRYEWVTLLAGGQEMVDNGERLRAEAKKMVVAIRTLAGELLGGLSKVTDDEELTVWSTTTRGLLGEKYHEYNAILRAVVGHVHEIIDSEAWKAVAQRYPQHVKTTAAVEVIASILAGIVTAAEAAAIAAAPSTFGLSIAVNVAGGAAKLAVNEVRVRILKWVRDADVADLKQAYGAHAQNFAYGHLNADLTVMPERVLAIQTENTVRIVKVVGAGLEALPGWGLISTAVVEGVNAYYRARVEALKSFLTSQGGRVREEGGLKAAIKEWFAGDVAKEIAPESAADIIGKTSFDKEVFRTAVDNAGVHKWGEALNVAVPAELTNAAPTVLASLGITLAGKLLTMVIARMPIEMAQPIDGTDLLTMKEELSETVEDAT